MLVVCDNVTYFSDFPEDQKEWSLANGVQGTNCGLRVFLERGLTYPYRSRRGGGLIPFPLQENVIYSKVYLGK